MFQSNARKVGGFSLESYEPTDIKEEEKNQNENLMTDIFAQKYSRNNFDLGLHKNHNHPYYHQKNISNFTFYNSKNFSKLGNTYPPTYISNNYIQQNYGINNINCSETIPNLKQSSTPMNFYSNKTKIVYPSSNRTIINYVQNYNSPQINYINNMPQSIHRSETTNIIPTLTPTQIVNKPAFNKNTLIITAIKPNTYVMPMNTVQQKQTILPKYSVVTKRILPIYPTLLTFRKRNVF